MKKKFVYNRQKVLIRISSLETYLGFKGPSIIENREDVDLVILLEKDKYVYFKNTKNSNLKIESKQQLKYFKNNDIPRIQCLFEIISFPIDSEQILKLSEETNLHWTLIQEIIASNKEKCIIQEDQIVILRHVLSNRILTFDKINKKFELNDNVISFASCLLKFKKYNSINTSITYGDILHLMEWDLNTPIFFREDEKIKNQNKSKISNIAKSFSKLILDELDKKKYKGKEELVFENIILKDYDLSKNQKIETVEVVLVCPSYEEILLTNNLQLLITELFTFNKEIEYIGSQTNCSKWIQEKIIQEKKSTVRFFDDQVKLIEPQ